MGTIDPTQHHPAFAALFALHPASAAVDETFAEYQRCLTALTESQERATALLADLDTVDALLVDATGAERDGLEQRRAAIMASLSALPGVISEHKRRTVLAHYVYLQTVRSEAQAEAGRLNAELESYRGQQRGVKRQIAALTPPAPTSFRRPLATGDEERRLEQADVAQRTESYASLMQESRAIADEARPIVSACNVATMAAEVAASSMARYTTVAARTLTIQEAADWWARHARSLAERETQTGGVFPQRMIMHMAS